MISPEARKLDGKQPWSGRSGLRFEARSSRESTFATSIIEPRVRGRAATTPYVPSYLDDLQVGMQKVMRLRMRSEGCIPLSQLRDSHVWDEVQVDSP